MALRPNLELIAAPGAIQAHRTRPVSPGDSVTVLGSGFGQVVPERHPGEVVHGLRDLASGNLRLLIGQLQVPARDLVYAGASPHYAGLQQLTFRLPATVSPGAHSVRLLAGGIPTSIGPMLEVAMPAPQVTAQACTPGLELGPLERCTLSLADLDGVVEIDVDGKACLLVPSGTVNDRWSCGEAALDLGSVSADVRIEKADDDDTWTLVAPPEPEPEAMPEG